MEWREQGGTLGKVAQRKGQTREGGMKEGACEVEVETEGCWERGDSLHEISGLKISEETTEENELKSLPPV